MRRFLLGLAAAAALTLAGTAAAGGWATAGVSPPSDGTGTGDTWNAQITILQHGQTPLVGVNPSLTIRNQGTGETKKFAATPTDKPGVYLAKVVFPSAGTWSYEVYDGFSRYGGAQTHKFAAVQIVGPADGDSFPLGWTIGGSTALAFLLGVLLFFGLRRRPGLATAGLR